MSTIAQDTSIVNGINVTALKEIIAHVAVHPESATTHWKVQSRWQGGTRTEHVVDGFGIGDETIERRFQLYIDEPCELGGTNRHANPQEYLLAATNACMMVGYAAVAAVMGVELTKLEVEITGDIDLRGFLDIDRSVPAGYRQLHAEVHIAGNGTKQQFEKMHEVVLRTSPNYYNMTHPVEVTSRLIVE